MSKFIVPQSSTIPPRPLNNRPIPNVVRAFDTRGVNKANAPLSNETEQTIGNFLSPPPREQLVDPASRVMPNQFYLNTPYDIKGCKFTYDLNQNVVGKVCNYTGNANFARGNQFSYDFKNLYDSEKYTVEQPVLEPTNPLMVSNSPFYPYPGFEYRVNPNYKTYPYYNDYLGGKPFYRNPYNTEERFAGIKPFRKKKTN